VPLMNEFLGYDAALSAESMVRAADGLRFEVRTQSGRSLPGSIAVVADGVVRLRIGHSSDAHPVLDLSVPLDAAASEASISSDACKAELEGGGLRASLTTAPWSTAISRSDGTVLWRSSIDDVDQKGRQRVLPLGVEGDPVQRITAAFEVEPHERFYGLGEKFCAVDKFGLSIVSSNSNAGGATSEQAYKNVPFFVSSRGYGVFFNTTTTVRHDVANPSLSILSYVATVEGAVLDMFLIDGPDPKTVLARYSDLTGHATVPPLWSFGLWISRFYFERWQTLEEACDGFRARGIPMDVVNPDVYWMDGDRLSDMQWDETRFPDAADHVAALRAKDIRVCLWEYPYLSQSSPLYDEAWAKGYLAKMLDGGPCLVQTTLPVPTHHLDGFRGVGSLISIFEQPLVAPGALIDFTNPDATRWWQDLHRDRLRDGVAVFKCDFGEDIPDEALFHDGRTGREVHNIYPLLYQQAVADVVEQETGERMIWGRSGWAGGQRFPVHWGGDPVTTFSAMAGTLRAGLSYGLSGVPFWSHDIGGFAGPAPSIELFVRWAQFGLLSSHARTHGCTPREPWEFGDEAEDIFKRYAMLRYRLLAYLHTLAVEAAATGVPLMRAMVLEFPDDRTGQRVDSQYLLGPDLLIAPVMNPEGDASVYLPAGTWLDWWTGEEIDGPRWVERRALDLSIMPVYLRAGGMIPLIEAIDRTEDADWSSVTLIINPVAEGERRFSFPDGTALTARIVLSGGRVRLELAGDRRSISILRPGSTAKTDSIELEPGGQPAVAPLA